ncbi:MAG: hypothetical protein LUH53_10545, partial [Lachnospiraceae bacterium]|nr:hypothetical protein [Lachnospiraceae bacterium]
MIEKQTENQTDKLNEIRQTERVLVIAGGAWQTPLVEKVKAMGYEVVNSNLYEDSPAFAFADYCEVADVL